MTSPEITDIVNDAEAVGETYFETIQRLAALPIHEYERCRKEEAKRLSMRTSVLDNEVKSARPKDEKGNDLGLFDPEPWAEEVGGDDLLDRIILGFIGSIICIWSKSCLSKSRNTTVPGFAVAIFLLLRIIPIE